MPYRRQHSCLVNEEVVSNLEPKKIKTKVGEIWVVMGTTRDGRVMPRSIRFPATVPVSVAQSMCVQKGGKFEPATPLDPQRQLLSEGYGFEDMSAAAKKLILSSLIESFEMPVGFPSLEGKASEKKKELLSAVRRAKALGTEIKERKNFKLSDLTFYLDMLESLGG